MKLCWQEKKHHIAMQNIDYGELLQQKILQLCEEVQYNRLSVTYPFDFMSNYDL